MPDQDFPGQPQPDQGLHWTEELGSGERQSKNAAAIRSHLALYDDMPPAPPAPPFASVQSAIRAQSTGTTSRRTPHAENATRSPTRRILLPLGVAAAVLAALLVWPGTRTQDTPNTAQKAPTLIAGRFWQEAENAENAVQAATVQAATGQSETGQAFPRSKAFPRGKTWRATAPTELRWQSGCRGVHVIADAGTALRFESTEAVTVVSGRIWCEVDPAQSLDANEVQVHFGTGATNHTLHVIGTQFVVDATENVVSVARGVVRVDGTRVEAGSRWSTEGVAALRADALARGGVGAFDWMPRPTLTLEQEQAQPATGAGVAGAGVFAFALIVQNPSAASVRLPSPESARTGLWIEWLDREGKRLQSLPVRPDAVQEGAQWLRGSNNGSGWILAPGSQRTIRIRFRAAHFGVSGAPKGAYRCRALIRPAGAPPVLSNQLDLKE